MLVKFFSSSSEFRKWLVANHSSETELIVGFYKVKTGRPSMTWSQSVDQALCFGWIDGVRRSIDEESYSIRFTPRKKNSIWSTVNIKKVEELKLSGEMTAFGLQAYSHRTEAKSHIYSHETKALTLDSNFLKQFKSNPKGWEFFNKQAPSYQKVTIHWIMSAKQEKTRLSRLEKTIAASEGLTRIH